MSQAPLPSWLAWLLPSAVRELDAELADRLSKAPLPVNAYGYDPDGFPPPPAARPPAPEPPRLARGMAELLFARTPWAGISLARMGSMIGTPENCIAMLEAGGAGGGVA